MSVISVISVKAYLYPSRWEFDRESWTEARRFSLASAKYNYGFLLKTITSLFGVKAYSIATYWRG